MTRAPSPPPSQPEPWPRYVSPTSHIIRAGTPVEILTPGTYTPRSPQDFQALPETIRAGILILAQTPIPPMPPIPSVSHTADVRPAPNSPSRVPADADTKIPRRTPSPHRGDIMTEQTPEDSRIRALTAAERETTVTASDADDIVRIWTAQRRYITRLRAHPKAVETGTGYHGTTEWAKFEIPAAEWNPASGIKRNAAPMTEEQKAAARANLARGRVTQAEAD